MNKKAQSELAGFAIIIVIVSVLILIFISFSIKGPSKNVIKSYETESFVQSFLQFTSSCERENYPLSMLKLIKYCGDKDTKGICDNNVSSCKILNETSKNLVNSAWVVGSERPVKGYDFKIIYKGKTLVFLERGNKTNQNKGSDQVFDGDLEISMTSYS